MITGPYGDHTRRRPSTGVHAQARVRNPTGRGQGLDPPPEAPLALYSILRLTRNSRLHLNQLEHCVPARRVEAATLLRSVPAPAAVDQRQFLRGRGQRGFGSFSEGVLSYGSRNRGLLLDGSVRSFRFDFLGLGAISCCRLDNIVSLSFVYRVFILC